MDAIIIGGGVAGLVCARELAASGVSCQVLEASDDVGGRVRTDEVDGFQLDRGFQVLLTAYPEAQLQLDYQGLDLRAFEPGALIRVAGKFTRLVDPWRRPRHLLATARSSAATLTDKLRIAKWRRECTRQSLEELFKRPEVTTAQRLAAEGFSPLITERFWRPFLGGVLLDHALETSSRMSEFAFRMFAQGDAAIPALGMRQIPRQLAAGLPPGTIRTNTRVAALEDQTVVLESGERLSAERVFVATEAPVARRLLDDPTPASGRQVGCLYFAADEAPLAEPILVLNGEGPSDGPVNNLCVPSQVAPDYAPGGKALVSVTVLAGPRDEVELETAVRRQLRGWFGAAVERWTHLRTYWIDYALPVQSPPALSPVGKSAEVRPGVWICGDHCDTASINGAMAAGRRAAEAALRV